MKKITRSMLALLLVLAMVLPSLTGIITAATHNDNIEAISNVSMNTSYIATVPNDAKWFFDANGEVASFGTADIDVYRNDLPTNSASAAVSNNLTLYSSTDGGIYNLPNMIYSQYGSPKNPGVFAINWESGYYADWANTTVVPADTLYTAAADVPVLSTLYGNGYTDGTYTLVGWGGDYQPGVAKKELTIRLKDNGDGTLADALSHMTIYLVGPYGAIYDKIWVKSQDGTDNGEVNCLYTAGQDEDGNYVFKAKLNGSVYAQGIKIAFDHTSAQEGSDTTLRHSGTLLIAQVEIACGDNNTYNDFSPIKYYANADTGIKNYMQSPLDSNFLPFIRAKTNNTGTAEGSTSGANISTAEGYTWHMWTMSTSDANIVNNHTSSVDALQIKYRNDTVNMTGNGYKAHETYAELAGTKDLNAHWLVMTMGTAQLDTDILRMQVQLIDNEGNARIVPLSSFRTGTDANASSITADYLNGTYRTVYYDLNQLQDFNGFRTIRFLFDGVADGKDSNNIRNSRYFYLNQVYLIGEGASVHKSVDKTSAELGDELTYTVTVTNNGTLALNNYTVNDNLPASLQLKSISLNGSDFTNYTNSNNALTINGGSLAIGATDTYQIKAQITGGASVLENTAVVTKLNNESVEIYSNKVGTTVKASGYVFFAEINQETTLPITLGSTAKETYTTETYEKTTNHTITVNGNANGSDDASASINVNIPAGATVRLYGPDSSFLFMNTNSVVIGGSSWNLSNAAASGSYSTSGSISTIDNAQICGFGNGAYVQFNNVPSGDVTVTLNLDKMWASPREFTLSVITTEERQVVDSVEYVNDVFKTIPGTTPAGATLNANGAIGANSGNLLYTSTLPGVDSFNLAITAGDGTEKNVLVTVYNFDVVDHLYVLDYGLPVDLAGADPTAFAGVDQAILNDAASNQLINQNVGVAFSGVSNTELKTGNVAEAADYTIQKEMNAEGVNGGLAAEYNAATSDLKVTYTPNRFMDCADVLYYGVQVSVDNTATSNLNSTTATPVMQGQIKVIPASVVYYEDNFAASNVIGGSENGVKPDGDNGIIYGGGTITMDTTTDSTQSNDLGMQYGYDPAYADDAMFSDGSATELPGGAWAMFKFKGTGFDIVSHTATDTGTIMAFVYKASDVTINNETGRLVSTTEGVTYVKPISVISVDTYYENDGTDGLYQIPVISWTSENNDYDEYVVRLAVSTKKVDGEAAARPVEIDGIRIYNPGGTETEQVEDVYEEYVMENNGVPNETEMVFKEVRALVLGEDFQYNAEDPLSSTSGTAKASLVTYKDAGSGKVTFLTGATVTENFTGAYFGDTTASPDEQYSADLLNYAIQGPNNELYLSEGYAVAFVVSGLTKDDSIQIGMKAVSGNPVLGCYTGSGWAKLVTDNADGKLNTATEMYYKLPLASCYQPDSSKDEFLVILRVDTSDSTEDIISLTNLKVDEAAVISAPSDDLKQAITDETQIATENNVLVGKNGYSVIDNQLADKFVSFATNTSVVAVEVRDANGNVLSAVAYSYIFQDANTKTWTIHYNPEVETYSIYVLTDTLRYQVNPATN